MELVVVLVVVGVVEVGLEVVVVVMELAEEGMEVMVLVGILGGKGGKQSTGVGRTQPVKPGAQA